MAQSVELLLDEQAESTIRHQWELLADAGLELSLGKMSALWTGTPKMIRLDDLDVICHVLACEPSDLLVREPAKVAARKPAQEKIAGASDAPPIVRPRPGNPRSTPPL